MLTFAGHVPTMAEAVWSDAEADLACGARSLRQRSRSQPSTRPARFRVVSDDEFAVYYDYDTTFKPNGQRSSMREMALYGVRNGQTVREEFFYKPSAG